MSSLVGRGDAPLCPDAVVLCWNDDSLGTRERYPGLRLLLGAVGENGNGTFRPGARVGACPEAAGFGI